MIGLWFGITLLIIALAIIAYLCPARCEASATKLNLTAGEALPKE